MEILNKYRPLFFGKPKTRYFLITGGRGSGKSYAVSLFLLNLTYEAGHVILFTRWTLTSAHISIIPEFIEKIEALNKQADFEITNTEIVNKHTGSRILFRGIKTSQGTATANLKSIQGVTTWCLDEAEELTDEDVFDRIDLSVRSTDHPNRVILVMNPSYKGHFIYQRWMAKGKENDTTYIHTTYRDNKRNLSESFLQAAAKTQEANPLRYNHLFQGTWLDDAEGILWNRKMLDQLRTDTKPDLTRIIVAIDPATTKTMESDETGIIVAGKAANGYAYVLEDLSGKYSPNEWATVAAQAVRRYNADAIVAEKNQGGEMVESVIRQVDKQTRVKLVTATKGKATRAEPVYSLYEQGKVWHLGHHPQLEQQMVTFNPESNKDSPDRVDALVWAVTELCIRSQREIFGI
jgi:PBSX family phage terminase large subunit